MSARGFFNAGVRLLAVWFWTQAAYWAYWATLKAFGTGLGNPAVPSREDVAVASLNLFLGLFLFVGARALTWLAFGDAPKEPSAIANSSADTTPNDAQPR
jgi:hypothetical protein